MLSGYKKQSSEWLLDEIIKEANEVEFPSESNLLFELRSELLSRLTKRAADVCPVCAGKRHIQTKSRGLVKCTSCNGTGQRG